MKKEDLRAALAAAGLDRLKPYLDQLTLPAIRIEANLLADDDLPVGASKLGGRPDLPHAQEWPTYIGNPLAFLAQFNLAELQQYDVDSVLPPTGILGFSYDFVSGPYGIYPDDRDGWRVLYMDDGETTLSRRRWPTDLAPAYRLPASEPWFSTVTTLSSEPDWIIGMTTRDEERLKLAQLVDVAVLADAGASQADNPHEIWGNRHQLLGYPWLGLHRAMPIACELAANGQATNLLSVLVPAERGEEGAWRDLQQAYKRWQLLLQLGNVSGIRAPMSFGNHDPAWDNGTVWRLAEVCDLWAGGEVMYFWIERDRLARLDFSNIWLVGSSRF